MLHRMALRVLPSLSLAVTDDSVRKQKRLVMLVPGLVAFGIYRLAKHIVPLAEPVVLLLLSGMVGLLTALMSYRMGRGTGWVLLWREDGRRLLSWMGAWIGFVYASQLSLLVLALLWLVGYDYLKHPDGPSMMAIIISCTAVARDAFEIGHVRKLSLMGRPCPTFPNGLALRSLLATRLMMVGPWVLSGLLVGAGAASLGLFVDNDQATLVQLVSVTIAAGGLAVCAYFGGLRPSGAWIEGLMQTKTAELLKYWWWPGLAFASTYYLVVAGAVIFLLKHPGVPTAFAVCGGGLVAGLMALYGYYLGHRRQIEETQGISLSPSLLRCPFVMGILSKSSPSAVVGASKG